MGRKDGIMKKRIEELGYDISDRAEWVREGSDFDEECQKATDEIADNLEIERNYENEDYVAINEWVNEQMTEYLEQ